MFEERERGQSGRVWTFRAVKLFCMRLCRKMLLPTLVLGGEPDSRRGGCGAGKIQKLGFSIPFPLNLKLS